VSSSNCALPTTFLLQVHFIAIVALITSFDSFATYFVAPVFANEISYSSAEPAVAAAATATIHNVRIDAFNEDNVEQWFVSHQAECESQQSRQIK